MLKPPRPGSMGAIVAFPPPPSCSPLSGKSSSNTIRESLPVVTGLGSTRTLTGEKGVVLAELHPVTRTLQAGGIGAPLMPWPQLGSVALRFSAPVEGQVWALVLDGNGLAASPGNTEM